MSVGNRCNGAIASVELVVPCKNLRVPRPNVNAVQAGGTVQGESLKRRPLVIPVVLLSLAVGVRTSFATDMNDQSVGTLFNCSGRAVKLAPSEVLKLIAKRIWIEPPSMLHNAQLHGTVTVEVGLNEGACVCAGTAQMNIATF